MRDLIWSYVSNRYENDGVLVDADEVYAAFQMQFDNGADVWSIDEVIEDFASCSDLTGIKIEYEGDIHAVCYNGAGKDIILSSQTA